MLKSVLFCLCCIIYKSSGFHPFHWFNFKDNYEPFIENMTNIPPLHKMWMDLPLEYDIPDNQHIYYEKLETKPRFRWEYNATDYYCLFLTSLDCDFERWGFVETHHWLVVNIPGIDVDKGEVILSYLPPKYIKNGPMYRAIVHRQPLRQHFKELQDSNFNRNSTTYRKFAAAHNFTKDPRYSYILPFAWKPFFLTDMRRVTPWKGLRGRTPKIDIPGDVDKIPLMW